MIAGGLLWVYDPPGALTSTSRQRPPGAPLPGPDGHWNSPIVAGGRVYLPTGDANQHDAHGVLSIFHAG